MENKKITLEIEQLEERIAPIVDPFVAALGVTLPGAGGGSQAAGALGATGQIGGFPVMQNNPGVGPS